MVARRQLTSKEKGSFWQDHINSWQQSGLNQAEYCRQQGLGAASFTYWKKKLSLASNKSTRPRFYPLTVQDQPKLRTSSNNSGLRLVVGGSRLKIEVENNFSPTTLLQLVTTLEKLESKGSAE